jgi:lipoate---protein ligase
MNELRFIDLGHRDAREMMAINEALFKTLDKTGESIGFLWNTDKSIIMGYSQLIEKELNLGRCAELGYQVTRRISGGGMAFSSAQSQVQYGYIAPIEDIALDLTESYKIICGIVMHALEKYGLKGEFKPINDVLCNGKKISGSAQTRGNNVLLQHGTLLVDFNIKEMLSCSNIPLEKISDKGIKSIEERLTDLNRTLGKKIPLPDAGKAMRYGFEKNFNVKLKESKLTAEEETLKKKLLPRYYDEKWLFRFTKGTTRSKGNYPLGPEVMEFNQG